jgi:acetyl-CoA carboxylase biotin carboxyl carrier protein
MNLEIISQLVRILREAPDVGAIEIRRAWFGAWSSVRVSKAGHAHGGAAGGEHVVVTQGSVAPAPAVGAGGSAPSAPPTSSAGPVSKLLEIKSPMVGTFYTASEPGAAPYVKPGGRVATGQVVCIIEAMKIMNEIEAEVAGVVREVCVESAQPVEFGQVLFRVDPNG